MSSANTVPAAPMDPAIPCPSCGRNSSHVKSLRMGVLIFLGVGGFWRTWTSTGCASCVRSRILECAGMNLITAHVLWPIAVLPWMTIQLMRTFLEGHSPDVLVQLGLPVPPRRSMWEQFREQLPVAFRVLGLLQVLLAVALATGLVWLLGAEWFGMRGLRMIAFRAFVAVAAAGAGYLVATGLSKLVGWSPTLVVRLAAGLCAGILAAISTPMLATLPWISIELELRRQAVDGNDDTACKEYRHRIPPQLWRAGPIGRHVELQIPHLRGVSSVAVSNDLDNIRYLIEQHHPNDPEFAAVHQRIKSVLVR